MKLVIEGKEKNISSNFFPHDANNVNEKDLKKVNDVLTSGRLSLFNNSIIQDFESGIKNLVGTNYCSSFTNCTSALDTAIRCITNPGDEVIIPAYTYMATLMAVLSAKCIPVLVDIERDSFTIDVKKIEEKITNKTKAIIPVHIFGNPVNMIAVMKIANKHNIRVIEDCAHALTAKYQKQDIGSYDIGCHSFGENKILRLGEGGAITTNDEEVYQKSLTIRHEGEVWKRTKKTASSGHDIVFGDVIGGIDYITEGHNFRITPLISALGLSKLNDLDDFISKMNSNALYLKNKLSSIENIKPQKSNDEDRIYSSFVSIFEHERFDRDEFLFVLAKEGVPVGVHFPIALHETSLWKQEFGTNEIFENASYYAKNHFALPIYPLIEKDHLDVIAEKISFVLNAFNDRPEDVKKTLGDFRKSKITDFYSGVYINV